MARPKGSKNKPKEKKQPEPNALQRERDMPDDFEQGSGIPGDGADEEEIVGDAVDKIFKATAVGDTLYIKAVDEDSAYAILKNTIGDMPRNLITFTEVAALPEGEQLLNE